MRAVLRLAADPSERPTLLAGLAARLATQRCSSGRASHAINVRCDFPNPLDTEAYCMYNTTQALRTGGAPCQHHPSQCRRSQMGLSRSLPCSTTHASFRPERPPGGRHAGLTQSGRRRDADPDRTATGRRYGGPSPPVDSTFEPNSVPAASRRESRSDQQSIVLAA